MSPRQTGVAGRPSEPFVVSFGVAGPHGAGAPALGALAGRLRETVGGIRARHRAEGWLKWDRWILMRVTPGGRQRSWVHDDGVIDEDRWRESLEGVPEEFDNVALSALPWGGLDLASPSQLVYGRDVRTLGAHLHTPAAGVDDASGALVDVLRDAAALEGVGSGFVHVDSIPDPYSEVVARVPRLSDDDFAVEVHGYYWAVLLSVGHLDRLGGGPRVRREAPCTRVEEVGDGSRLLCVLSDSPLAMDAGRVVAWREFLAPVLRSGYPTGWEDVGSQHPTPLSRPLWLFEGDPAPRATTAVLQSGVDTGIAPVPVQWLSSVQDPERPTCWLYPGPDFDRQRHSGVVSTVVRAWFLTGALGRLHDVDGRFHWSSDVTWDTDDAGADALVWQVELGDAPVEAAIARIAVALGMVASVLGGDVFTRLVVA